MVVFDWIGDSCCIVKLKDVIDVDIEVDKRCFRDCCFFWDYLIVFVVNDNVCKIEKL